MSSTADELYSFIKVDMNLETFSYWYGEPSHTMYQKKEVIKKDGGTRRLLIPHPAIAKIQKAIIPLLEQYPLVDNAYGHRRDSGGGAVEHGYEHLAPFILRMDIKNFFSSTTPSMFHRAIYLIHGTQLCRNLYDFTPLLFYTPPHEGVAYLPTGAPTSPLVASVAFTPIDRWIINRLSPGIAYTRYMDDLYFSGDEYVAELQKEITAGVEKHGWKINHNKNRIMIRGRDKQIVTGVCVSGSKYRLSKAFRRKLRAELDKDASKSVDEMSARMKGKMAYVSQVDEALYIKLSEYFLKRKEYWDKVNDIPF